jgi:hypothetical protein
MKGKCKPMTDDERRDELYAKFQETDEMAEWDDFVSRTRNALEANPAAETVTVPAAFLRRVIDQIGATPHMFSVCRDRFNELCDEMGLAEEKRPAPAAPERGEEEGF